MLTSWWSVCYHLNNHQQITTHSVNEHSMCLQVDTINHKHYELLAS
jgi:hypothetical protein